MGRFKGHQILTGKIKKKKNDILNIHLPGFLLSSGFSIWKALKYTPLKHIFFPSHFFFWGDGWWGRRCSSLITFSTSKVKKDGWCSDAEILQRSWPMLIGSCSMQREIFFSVSYFTHDLTSHKILIQNEMPLSSELSFSIPWPKQKYFLVIKISKNTTIKIN